MFMIKIYMSSCKGDKKISAQTYEKLSSNIQHLYDYNQIILAVKVANAHSGGEGCILNHL